MGFCPRRIGSDKVPAQFRAPRDEKESAIRAADGARRSAGEVQAWLRWHRGSIRRRIPRRARGRAFRWDSCGNIIAGGKPPKQAVTSARTEQSFRLTRSSRKAILLTRLSSLLSLS